MSDLSHKLTAERDSKLKARRERITEHVYPSLVASWYKRDASGWPDYSKIAEQAVKAADALIKAMDNDKD